MGICLSVLQADICNNLASIVAYLGFVVVVEEWTGYQRFKQLHVLSSEYRYPSVEAGTQSVSQLKCPLGSFVFCFYEAFYVVPFIVHIFLNVVLVIVQPIYNTHTLVKSLLPTYNTHLSLFFENLTARCPILNQLYLNIYYFCGMTGENKWGCFKKSTVKTKVWSLTPSRC